MMSIAARDLLGIQMASRFTRPSGAGLARPLPTVPYDSTTW